MNYEQANREGKKQNHQILIEFRPRPWFPCSCGGGPIAGRATDTRLSPLIVIYTHQALALRPATLADAFE